MKIVRPEIFGDLEWIHVYDYTMDTVKEFEEAGWHLSGTYYHFLTFWKYVDEK